MSKHSDSAVRFLIEVRTRLIYVLIILFLFFAVTVFFANQLYTLLSLPLLKFLPQGHLIATQLVSPFFVPLKLAFITAMVMCVPVFLYQVWAFVSPALYGYEKRLLWPFILIGTSLFYAGICFAYFVIFPLLFHFLTKVVPQGVILTPDITEYLNFTLKLLLTFGCLFEIPIIMVLLISLNVVTLERMIKNRSYAIIGAFILGMLLAPPDVFSQTVLALPIWFLYEAGIVLAKILSKRSVDNV